MTSALHLHFAISRLEARRREHLAQLEQVTLNLAETEHELEKMKLLRRRLKITGREPRHLPKVKIL